eukprot:5150371-Alexandrium_andersonii.AAC.3
MNLVLFLHVLSLRLQAGSQVQLGWHRVQLGLPSGTVVHRGPSVRAATGTVGSAESISTQGQGSSFVVADPPSPLPSPAGQTDAVEWHH